MACLWTTEDGEASGTFAVLPHQGHWFFDSIDLGALQGSSDDVIQIVVALLSRCTPPVNQTVKTPCINCLTACTLVRLTRSAAKSVGQCHSDFLIGESQT